LSSVTGIINGLFESGDLAESLGRNVQGRIEFTGEVLKGDETGQKGNCRKQSGKPGPQKS